MASQQYGELSHALQPPVNRSPSTPAYAQYGAPPPRPTPLNTANGTQTAQREEDEEEEDAEESPQDHPNDLTHPEQRSVPPVVTRGSVRSELKVPHRRQDCAKRHTSSADNVRGNSYTCWWTSECSDSGRRPRSAYQTQARTPKRLKDQKEACRCSERRFNLFCPEDRPELSRVQHSASSDTTGPAPGGQCAQSAVL